MGVVTGIYLRKRRDRSFSLEIHIVPAVDNTVSKIPGNLNKGEYTYSHLTSSFVMKRTTSFTREENTMDASLAMLEIR